jgi:DNA-directed RNA polymerase subunit RPC12/RpoP
MVGFCIHCGASTPDEFVIVNGEILPSAYVRCSYCGKMAGIKGGPEEDDRDLALLLNTENVVIKDGKVVVA